jgi:hypothetical protein
MTQEEIQSRIRELLHERDMAVRQVGFVDGAIGEMRRLLQALDEQERTTFSTKEDE